MEAIVITILFGDWPLGGPSQMTLPLQNLFQRDHPAFGFFPLWDPSGNPNHFSVYRLSASTDLLF